METQNVHLPLPPSPLLLPPLLLLFLPLLRPQSSDLRLDGRLIHIPKFKGPTLIRHGLDFLVDVVTTGDEKVEDDDVDRDE